MHRAAGVRAVFTKDLDGEPVQRQPAASSVAAVYDRRLFLQFCEVLE